MEVIKTKFEEHAVTLLVLSIFALLSWNTLTTYQNALILREISTVLRTNDQAYLRLGDSVSINTGEIRAHERRLSRIEDTRYDESDHKKFLEWVSEELNSKQNK